MHIFIRCLLFLALGLTPTLAFAQSSPVGLWRTIDDDTGEARSIVQIYEEDGQLYGDIVEILKARPDAPRNDDGTIICTACPGERKNQPVEGLNIIWGLEQDGDEWTGGKILDPENGKVYKSKVWLEDGRLHVRGFIGFSLIGRTQVWEPVEEED